MYLNLRMFLSRLGQMLVTLIGVSFLTFCLTFLAPGDPVMMILESGDRIVSDDLIREMRHEMGLDQPLLVQYGNWVVGVLHGDLGMSYSARKPVMDKLLEGIPGTFALAGMTACISLVLSLALGFLSAVKANRLTDYIVRGWTFACVSMPSFWIGLILLYIFGLKLGWFPIVSTSISLKGMVLPATTLAIYMSAKLIRQVRTIVLEELHQDYVMGARARGLSELKILWSHVLPNAVLPLLTIFSMSLGWLLGGVAVVEIVFAWPGIGFTAVHAIEMRDYPLVEGFVLFVAIVYMLINFLVDLSYAYLDPRLKKEVG